jgi:hypothetical protein
MSDKTKAELNAMLAEAVRNTQPQPLRNMRREPVREAQPEPKRKTRMRTAPKRTAKIKRVRGNLAFDSPLNAGHYSQRRSS